MLLFRERQSPCHSKIPNLQLTVAIDEQVTWLQVPVEDIGRVDILQPSHDLVEEELDMFIAERLNRMDDVVKVTLHKVQNHIHILKS